MPRYKYFDDETEIVEGMWAATGRAYYNPKTDTNWCHLPMEMRSECIKRMDFKTGMRLLRTSKTEKSLVESTKCHLESVKLEYLDSEVAKLTVMSADGRSSPLELKSDHEMVMDQVERIFQHCQIDNFEVKTELIDLEDQNINWITKLEKYAPFHFKTFRSSSSSSEIPLFFLKNSENVEEIMIYVPDKFSSFRADPFINLPAVINAKIVFFGVIKEAYGRIFNLVQTWIDNDEKIGKKMRFVTHCDEIEQCDPNKPFIEQFKERVESETNNGVRIRMNDPEKHVVLKFHWANGYSSMEYYSCMIIPSDVTRVFKNPQWAIDIQKDVIGDWQYEEPETEDSDYYYRPYADLSPWDSLDENDFLDLISGSEEEDF